MRSYSFESIYLLGWGVARPPLPHLLEKSVQLRGFFVAATVWKRRLNPTSSARMRCIDRPLPALLVLPAVGHDGADDHQAVPFVAGLRQVLDHLAPDLDAEGVGLGVLPAAVVDGPPAVLQ